MTLAAGTRLGPYEVLGPLGAGGMGEVYRARDTKLGREVAIKVLPEEMASDKERLARFEREARLLASLHHPYILAILDFGREHGTTYAATELLEGETLRARLTRGALPISKTLEYAREIAQGLSAAHAKGVVHRDLKPENLFVTKDGGIKILDFGLARHSYPIAEQGGDDLPTLAADSALGELRTAEGVVLGTVGYMSPEQVRGESADARSDIFSFGAVAYEMLTGERAFRRDSSLETLAAIARDEPPGMSSSGRPIPAPLEHVVRRCLEKSPDDRFQSARDLVFAFEEASGSHGQEKPPRSSSRSWQRVAIPIAGAALFLAIVIGLTWWLGTHHRAARKQVAPPGEQTAAARSHSPASPEPSPAKSIAVLPFENLSADKNNAYFADGIQDEILTRLAKLGELKVISRTSTSQYASMPEDLRKVGRELGVRNLLEGSVQKAGDEVLVNVQLIDAQSDSHLWAESYRRTLDDVFTVEGEVAKKIAAALEAKLTPREVRDLATAPTEHADAYEAFLRGRTYETVQSDVAHLQSAADAYGEAVRIDPSFVLAWARLSHVQAIRYLWFDRTAARLAAAKRALDHALKLDPDSEQTQLALGNYLYVGPHDYAGARAAFERALELAPNDSDAMADIGYVERRQGKWREALAHLRRASELDPRNNDVTAQAEQTYAMLRDFPTALELINRVLTIRPNDTEYVAEKAKIYRAMGKPDLAIQALGGTSIPRTEPTDFYNAMVQPRLDRRDFTGAERLLRKALAHPDPSLATPQAILTERLASTEQLAGDTSAARATYRRARTLLRKALGNAPNDPTLYGFLGLAEAGLGHKEAALAAGRRAVAMLPTSKDHTAGPSFEELLARIEAQVGEHGAAIATLGKLLTTPYYAQYFGFGITVETLELDPSWDPLRQDPRFQALLRKPVAKT